MDGRWVEDPTGGFTHRWWDGAAWTDHVAVDGQQGRCPVGAEPREVARVRAGLAPVPAPPPPPRAATGRATSWPAGPAAPGRLAGPQQPYELASLGERFLGWLLDGVLTVVLLGVGWLVWAVLTAQHGQTPGKRILGMRVVHQDTGQPLDWATYVLLRGVVGGIVAYILNATVVGLVHYALPLFDDRRQFVWGKVSSSVVARA